MDKLTILSSEVADSNESIAGPQIWQPLQSLAKTLQPWPRRKLWGHTVFSCGSKVQALECDPEVYDLRHVAMLWSAYARLIFTPVRQNMKPRRPGCVLSLCTVSVSELLWQTPRDCSFSVDDVFEYQWQKEMKRVKILLYLALCRVQDVEIGFSTCRRFAYHVQIMY